jgi:hypothetical protein
VVFLSFKTWGHQGARIVLHNLPVKKKKKPLCRQWHEGGY